MQNEIIQREPIAIIGIGCRLPGGVASADALWNLLRNKQDAIIDVPPDRWDRRRFYHPNKEKPGKMYVNQGGFLQEDITRFDPLFFGFSPREAPNVDPQQRLFLEVTYNALEDAGLQVETLAKQDVGVFVGGFFLDFKLLQLSPYNRNVINMHTGTGVTMVMLSNRIAYAFDFRGPAVTMDTACSSSLVAIHYACQSIWNHESTLAVAGGVHVMLRPEPFIALSKGSFLSTHGRCKAFDIDAGGYTRAEGAGAVILKPYQQALKDRDPIYALVRSTGVNQDGQTPGITVPNPLSQEALIRKVYRQAQITVNDIHYVEAHGTGTQAGDPAEITALHAVLSEGRHADAGEKVLVGSIKTNIGHAESVAGVAGFIKAALCLQHKQVPPNLHFSTPNPKLNYDRICLKVPTDLEELPKDRISYASINSFGYGGTNAHVVLQEPPSQPPATATTITIRSQSVTRQDTLCILPVTARSEEALKALAGDYATYLQTHAPTMSDFLYSTAFRRSHHPHRLTIVADALPQMAERLQAYQTGQWLEGMVVNQAQMTNPPKVVFVYTGMGPQWWKMGRELMETEPVFRHTLETCDRIFQQYAGWSILAEMVKDEQTSRMAETQIAQPANFLIQAALTDLWKHYGIEPAAIVGHSVGEVTAAYASGVLSLEDAVLVSYHRGRLQQRLAGTGKLLAVGLSEAEVTSLLSHFQDVSIAAINSPRSITLSGNETILHKMATVLEHQQIFNRMLQVEIPYHSQYMEAIKDDVAVALHGVTPHQAHLPTYSTVTTGRIQPDTFDAAYWWQNIRQPVRLAQTIATMVKDGYTLFLEVGPHPVLRTSLQECFQELGTDAQVLHSLKRNEPEGSTFLKTLGTLFTLGLPIAWERFTTGGQYIKLPPYPWQKDRYPWNEAEVSRQDRLGRTTGHAFCQTQLPTSMPTYEVELNTLFFPFLQDHLVQKMVVLPGAAYIECGLALFQQENQADLPCTLENLQFRSMLVLDENKVQTLQITMNPESRHYSVYSGVQEDATRWTQHATGRILLEPLVSNERLLSVRELQQRCPQALSVDQFYQRLARIGLQYLPHFRTVTALYKGDNELLARLEGHVGLADQAQHFLLHPTILDGAIQTLAAFFDQLVVPATIARVNYYASPRTGCWSYLKITEVTANSITGNIWLLDDQGQVFAELEGLECKRVSRDESELEQQITSWLYDLTWQAAALPETVTASDETWLICMEQPAPALLDALAAQGIRTIGVTRGPAYQQVAAAQFQLPDYTRETILQVLTALQDDPIQQIVYLAAGAPQQDLEALTAADIVGHCMPMIAVGQAWTQARPQDRVKLTVVTRQAQIVGASDTIGDAATSALWGLGRLISNEQPNITCKLLDLDADLGNSVSVLSRELGTTDAAEDVAWRDGNRWVKRLQHWSPPEEPVGATVRQVQTATTPVELIIGTPGKIASLAYRQVERPALQADEVEVEVHSVPLNYTDVREVLGQSPHHGLGLECCGVVRRVGDAVTTLHVGDDVVVSTLQGSFRSYVTVKSDGYIRRKPQRFSMEEAAMIVPFMTAVYGLGYVAQLEQGEKVLIHNAADSIGLAAVQFAQWIGAEIFATAGTPEKRRYLQSLGIKHVLDSQTLAFAKTIRELTKGQGVDVVMSALSGEALYQSFLLLAPYGRFIELGKQDATEHLSLPMEVFNKNITFSTIDIDLLQQHPHLGRQMWDEVFEGFEAGYFSALPIKGFPAAQVVEAFDDAEDHQHIGGVVLNLWQQVVDIPVEKAPALIQPQASYLITGGTRGLGLEIAKWLSAKGASHLVLISRSGANTAEAQEAIQAMEQQGTRVLAAAVDVAQRQELATLLQQVATTMPPLRGIFHCAMVLDDGFLMDMTAARFNTVMQPKVGGLLHLHHLTRMLPLDFFVAFSSISSLIGNPGQANYVAANAFLDAFAHLRRRQGLPATTINLGVLEEVGVAARHADVKTILEQSGIKGFTTNQVLHALERVLAMRPTQIGLFDVDWPRWGQQNPEAAGSSRFTSLIAAATTSAISPKMQALLDALATMAEPEKREYLDRLLAQEIATVLRLPVEKIDRKKPLMEQGIDSLMTVELRNRLNTALGATLPGTFLFAYPTVHRLTSYVLEELLPTETEPQAAAEAPEQSATLQSLNDLLQQIDA